MICFRFKSFGEEIPEAANSSINLITVKPQTKDLLEQTDVEKALARSWAINGKDIKVEVDQNKVKLSGLVHSLYQKEEAGRLAWNAQGVTSVDNELA